MFTPIDGLADGTVGFRASAKVTSDDYKNVMNPAIDEVLKDHDKVNLVYVVSPEFDGYSLGGFWADTKEVTRGFKVWDRIAFVSDIDWMNHVVPTAGHLVNGEVRAFPLSEEPAAIAWAGGED